jgi:hypothetical protein
MFAASKSGSAADPTDPQFNYVTMLLHGDGTNGAQNNTFLDSSTNNFTITRNGNTTQGTFTPYGSNWSNYFDGTGDYLTVPDNAVLDMGSSDFTIEGFVFLSSTGASQTFVAKGTGAGNQASYHIVFNGTNWLYYLSGNGSTWSIASGVTMGAGTANTWQHLALVRSGSTFTPYVNGVSGTTTSSATALFDSTNVFSIGADDATNQRITGYISNCRVVKGTAVYTGTFTPSTTPLTAITNTQLLTCQSNRFIDNSTNAFTITKSGDVSVQRFSPFSPTTAYSTSVIGGSGYFDGSGDNLSIASSAGLAIGSGQFTVEVWIYFNTVTALGEFYEYTTTGNSGCFTFFFNGTNALQAVATGGAGPTTVTWVPKTGEWYHIAASRDSSNNQRVFVNGALLGTATSTNNYGQNGFRIFTTVLNGYMSDARTVVGTCLYTAAFTPPTAPLTAVSGTQLLLSTTNAGILDNAMMNDLETVGNAQISTSVKKYGTGSLYFDGTGDYLSAIDSPNTEFGASDFTVEMWAYYSSTSGTPVLIDKRANTSGYSPFIFYTTGGTLVFYASSNGSSYDIANGVTIGSVTTGTWYHVAASRSGSSIRLFLNGTLANTVTSSAALVNNSDAWTIGATVGGNYFNGYIDDLRITKYARYTANFTPSTTAFPDKG